jgi:hypothetical protein
VDTNDAFFLSEYKRLTAVKTVLALCFAEREETYHHWRVYSRGSDGVCVEFDAERIKDTLASTPGVKHGRVDYDLLSNITRMREVDAEKLPFLKRWPFGDEREYRAIYVNTVEEKDFRDVPIELGSLRRIT